MQLKNKEQREEFLRNYKKWELWKEIPELDFKLYRFKFPNGTVIIATEYASMKFVDYKNGRSIHEKGNSVNYSLLLSSEDKFKATGMFSDISHKLYNPHGDTRASIIEYLTKTKPEV